MFDYFVTSSALWYRVDVFHQDVTCGVDSTEGVEGVWLVPYTECVEVRCPSLPVWGNLLINSNSTTVGSVVMYGRTRDSPQQFQSKCDNDNKCHLAISTVQIMLIAIFIIGQCVFDIGSSSLL